MSKLYNYYVFAEICYLNASKVEDKKMIKRGHLAYYWKIKIVQFRKFCRPGLHFTFAKKNIFNSRQSVATHAHPESKFFVSLSSCHYPKHAKRLQQVALSLVRVFRVGFKVGSSGSILERCELACEKHMAKQYRWR